MSTWVALLYFAAAISSIVVLWMLAAWGVLWITVRCMDALDLFRSRLDSRRKSG